MGSPEDGRVKKLRIFSILVLGLFILSFVTPLGVRPARATGANYCTGGTETTIGAFAIHTYTADGTFSCPGTMNVAVLVVAGGGSGGNVNGGGGGAGGVIQNSYFSVTVGNKTVVVGAGGSNASGSGSAFDSLQAIGGGKGGNYQNNGSSGGSGGGGGSSGARTGGNPTAGQGYAGGSSLNSSPYPPGGGESGGAGWQGLLPSVGADSPWGWSGSGPLETHVGENVTWDPVSSVPYGGEADYVNYCKAIAEAHFGGVLGSSMCAMTYVARAVPMLWILIQLAMDIGSVLGIITYVQKRWVDPRMSA